MLIAVHLSLAGAANSIFSEPSSARRCLLDFTFNAVCLWGAFPRDTVYEGSCHPVEISLSIP